MKENTENTTEEQEESKMQYWLRLGIKISIAFELLVLFIIVFLFPERPTATDLRNGGILVDLYLSLGKAGVSIMSCIVGAGVIYAQIYIYKEIGSSWNKMSKTKKGFYTLVAGIPAIYFGSFLIYVVIVLIVILIAVWAFAAGQPAYNRAHDHAMRGSETTISRDDVRKIVDEEIKKY